MLLVVGIRGDSDNEMGGQVGDSEDNIEISESPGYAGGKGGTGDSYWLVHNPHCSDSRGYYLVAQNTALESWLIFAS